MNTKRETLDTFQAETNLAICVGCSGHLSSVTEDYASFLRKGGTLQEVTTLQILGFLGDKFINIKFLTPKNKEIDITYLYNKLNKYRGDRPYKNLAAVFKKLCPQSGHFFETSYGIGLEALFKSEQAVERQVEPVKQYLNVNSISYRTEYSDAGWVYRIIISKAKENIEKIKSII